MTQTDHQKPLFHLFTMSATASAAAVDVSGGSIELKPNPIHAGGSVKERYGSLAQRATSCSSSSNTCVQRQTIQCCQPDTFIVLCVHTRNWSSRCTSEDSYSEFDPENATTSAPGSGRAPKSRKRVVALGVGACVLLAVVALVVVLASTSRRAAQPLAVPHVCIIMWCRYLVNTTELGSTLTYSPFFSPSPSHFVACWRGWYRPLHCPSPPTHVSRALLRATARSQAGCTRRWAATGSGT